MGKLNPHSSSSSSTKKDVWVVPRKKPVSLTSLKPYKRRVNGMGTAPGTKTTYHPAAGNNNNNNTIPQTVLHQGSLNDSTGKSVYEKASSRRARHRLAIASVSHEAVALSSRPRGRTSHPFVVATENDTQALLDAGKFYKKKKMAEYGWLTQTSNSTNNFLPPSSKSPRKPQSQPVGPKIGSSWFLESFLMVVGG